MRHDELVAKFSQTVGVEKAESLVADAADELGIEAGGTYSTHEVADVCEAIRRATEGYVRLVATEVRVNHLAEQRFDALLDEISDPVVTVSFDGSTPVVEDVNPAFVEAFGYDRSAVGEPLPELIVPEGERESAADEWVRADSDGGVEVERLTADGERRTFLFRPVVASREQGTVRGYGIYTDITERTRRERRLELQNEQLERFASVVSHDLRNPLQVARARLDLIPEDHLPPDAREELATVRDTHERMERLVDDLLTLARQGRVVDDTDAVAFEPVVGDAWTAATTADATLEIDADEAVFAADRTRLRELLENLFRNAVEHSSTSPGSEGETADDGEASGDVTVRVGLIEEPPGFYVEDDGPGIPPEEREQVFEHGYTTDPDGTGFGLAIVRAVANAHGWTVEITDSEIGTAAGGESAERPDAPGARFEVTGVDFRDRAGDGIGTSDGRGNGDEGG